MGKLHGRATKVRYLVSSSKHINMHACKKNYSDVSKYLNSNIMIYYIYKIIIIKSRSIKKQEEIKSFFFFFKDFYRPRPSHCVHSHPGDGAAF